jgi:hypothetical protein
VHGIGELKVTYGYLFSALSTSLFGGLKINFREKWILENET